MGGGSSTLSGDNCTSNVGAVARRTGMRGEEMTVISAMLVVLGVSGGGGSSSKSSGGTDA